MKNIKKFIVLILAFAVCAAMLASCGGKKDDAVARFGGDSYIYLYIIYHLIYIIYRIYMFLRCVYMIMTGLTKSTYYMIV